MASILDRYGIKEVADLTFYEIGDDGKPSKPVLYIDTAKTSTVEQTAETAEARGGKGNPMLVSWDYGKEINVTIEDALFSPKSMAIMFGNGSLGNVTTISKVGVGTVTETGKLPIQFAADVYDSTLFNKTNRRNIYVGTETTIPESVIDGVKLSDVRGSNAAFKITKLTDENGVAYLSSDDDIVAEDIASVSSSALTVGKKVFFTFTQLVSGHEIKIDAKSFPGTYYVTGDTYARSDVTGKDEFFQFIIPKAKMNAENTITLEAEGDPSVFNMSLRVLRPNDGVMMKLVQYDLTAPTQA